MLSAADAGASIPHIRVTNAVAHFAASLPFRVRCSDDLDVGLEWADRHVALRHRELAPDPPGWKTALRFDVDCPCDRQPHARSGYCPRAATYWRDAMVAEPSFVVVNPTNGHAHYVYLLRGWIRIDGTDPAQLAAVRYFGRIKRVRPNQEYVRIKSTSESRVRPESREYVQIKRGLANQKSTSESRE